MWFMKPKVVPVPPRRVELRPEEKTVIAKFAEGDEDMKPHAIACYRRNIGRVPKTTAEMGFMAEIDTRSPDLAMRSYFRRRVLGQA
jgi:hypothetical protein